MMAERNIRSEVTLEQEHALVYYPLPWSVLDDIRAMIEEQKTEARLAQLGTERLPYKQDVGGSIPSASTRGMAMDVNVRFVVFKNFSAMKNFTVDKIDEKEIHEKLYRELLKEEWDWPLTREDLEITFIGPLV